MKRFLTLLTVAVASTAVVPAMADDAPPPPPPAAGGECVPKSTQDAVSACGTNKGGFTPKSDKPTHVGIGQVDTGTKKNAPKKPGNPDQERASAFRDARRAAISGKVEELIRKEIVQLEQLFKGARKTDPDRVNYARRLAETYVEWESMAQRKKTEAEIATPPKKDEADKAAKTVKSARTSAIKYYKLITEEYKSYPQLDEVLYYLAYEYEQDQNTAEARTVYKRIIDETPQSKYVPNAYLAFGELFFAEGQSDPSMYEFAKASYEEVLKYPPPDNKVWGYAKYKIGYVYWNLGDKTQHIPKALAAFKEVIEHSFKYASEPGVKALGDGARKDIIPVYALIGDPNKSYDFFKPLASNPPEDLKTYEMMDQLGLTFLDTGQYDEAIALYKDLMNRDKGENQCKYQAHIVEATMAKKGGKDKPQTKASLLELHKRYLDYKKESHSDEAKKTCMAYTAELMTETAMAWHLEAVGTEANRGTLNKETMKLAADLYEIVTDTFTRDEFNGIEFRKIVKEDWPTLLRVKYASADLMYFQQDWERCGPAFDKVVDEDPNSEFAPEAAFAAVLCYQKLYDKQNIDKDGKRKDTAGTGNLPGKDKGKKEEKATPEEFFKKKDMTKMQAGMTKAFNNYLCYIKPKDGDAKGQDQYVEVKYARARTYFESHWWEEAALGFKDVAMNHPSHETGMYAAQLYLETLNILGTHSDPKRPACYDEMAEAVPKMITLYCDGAKASRYQDQCTLLTKIQCDIQRLKADTLVENAKKGGANAIRDFETAAQTYLDLWGKYGEKQVEANKDPECNGMDEILFNAGESFQSARLLMKSIGARLKLVNNKSESIRKSDLSRRALYKIGGNWQAIADYDKAATFFERYTQEYPKSDKADVALSDAIVLRIGLGQEAAALKNAETYEKNYGASKPEETAKVAFAIGAYYVEREDWENARRKLGGRISMIDSKATLDVKAQAHAMLGRVFVNIKSDSNAASEYKKVQDLWKDPEKAQKEVMASAGDNQNDGLRRLVKALTSVGEAYFYFAEKEKKKVDAFRFPAYKGSDDKDSVLKHINTKVVEWLTKKKPMIEAAEKEYLKILELKPEPPPRWVTAAGSRVGAMWGEFVADFRSAPIPGAWKQKGDPWDEIRGAYYQALDEKSEPIKLRAKAAFESCLRNSVKYQFFDKFSRYCEEWLSNAYKKEYHVIDEFRIVPNRVGSGLNDRSFPLEIGGKPFNPNPPPPPEPEKVEKREDTDKADDKKKPKGKGKGK